MWVLGQGLEQKESERLCARGWGMGALCMSVRLTPPFWSHLATPADVALAWWPQSRQCG